VGLWVVWSVVVAFGGRFLSQQGSRKKEGAVVVTVGCVRGVARCCWVGDCSQVGCKRGLFCSCGAFRYGFGDRSLVGLVTVVR
jgi:hypothetical protein